MTQNIIINGKTTQTEDMGGLRRAEQSLESTAEWTEGYLWGIVLALSGNTSLLLFGLLAGAIK